MVYKHFLSFLYDKYLSLNYTYVLMLMQLILAMCMQQSGSSWERHKHPHYDCRAAAQRNPALKVTDSEVIFVSLTKAQKHTEHTTLMYLVSQQTSRVIAASGKLRLIINYFVERKKGLWKPKMRWKEEGRLQKWYSHEMTEGRRESWKGEDVQGSKNGWM